MQDYNARGRYHETLFKAECMKRGLVVLQPENAHLPFDVVVFVNGAFLRIQIKGTSSLRVKHREGKGWSKAYRIETRNSKSSYASLGVDFIAAYIEPTQAWYIIPIALATGRRFTITATPQGKAEQCRERWDHLGVVPPA